MSAVVKKSFPVTGLGCASCAIHVEGELKSHKGVVTASVNYANSSAMVEFEPGSTNAQD
jgi:P-type Cu2+ transporter